MHLAGRDGAGGAGVAERSRRLERRLRGRAAGPGNLERAGPHSSAGVAARPLETAKPAFSLGVAAPS